MFDFTNIKIKLATAAVVAAGALALPAMSSAATASGCPSGSPCAFVGPATQFEVNTGGPGSGGGPIVSCTTSTATATTQTPPTDLVDVTLLFGVGGSCTALGSLPATVACSNTPITVLDPVSPPGTADGILELGANDCTITIAGGVCTIRTSTGLGQDIAVHIAGADGIAPPSVLTVDVAGNTDALAFTAAGLCPGVPSSGTATFSDTSVGSTIVYTESGNNLVVS